MDDNDVPVTTTTTTTSSEGEVFAYRCAQLPEAGKNEVCAVAHGVPAFGLAEDRVVQLPPCEEDAGSILA